MLQNIRVTVAPSRSLLTARISIAICMTTAMFGCPQDVPSAVAIPCAAIQAQRDAERERRLTKYDQEQRDVDYRHAQWRSTGSASHFEERKKVKEKAISDLAAIDSKFLSQCTSSNATETATPAPLP